MNPLRVPFWYGEFPLTIDSKNRLLIPSEIRRLLVPETDGEAFIVTQRGAVPWMYAEKYYQQLVMSQIRPGVSPSEELNAFVQLHVAMANRVEWDNQGRVVLPDRVIKRAGLGKDVTLLGMYDHLELWNRTAWDARREELIARSTAVENDGKAAMKQEASQTRT